MRMSGYIDRLMCAVPRKADLKSDVWRVSLAGRLLFHPAALSAHIPPGSLAHSVLKCLHRHLKEAEDIKKRKCQQPCCQLCKRLRHIISLRRTSQRSTEMDQNGCNSTFLPFERH